MKRATHVFCIGLGLLLIQGCGDEDGSTDLATGGRAELGIGTIDLAAPVDLAAGTGDLNASVDLGRSCPVGQNLCGDTCIDLDTSLAHCGACGNDCAAGQVCSNGACTLTCAVNLASCGGGDLGAPYCANTMTDNANCGGCGLACGPGTVCANGGCAVTCAPSLTLCGGGDLGPAFCANTQTDNTHCGGCGIACDPGQACVTGGCSITCAPSLTVCGGGDLGAQFCANTLTDNANCGGCGIACDPGQLCTGGGCATNCGAGLTVCGGGDLGAEFCTNTQSDNANCGFCGNACAAGSACVLGGCAPQCTGGSSLCDDGLCHDLQNDNLNCGACSTAAAPTACATGEVCAGGTCGISCGGGASQCTTPSGDVCANLQSDQNHCGACNNPCSGGQICTTGGCCDFGDAFCGGTCIDPSADPNNCGGCGNVCGVLTPYCHLNTCVDFAPSCKVILANDPTAADGPYTILLPGNVIPTEVYCDMTTAGGGWTLIAKFTNADGINDWNAYAARWVDTSVVGDATNLDNLDAKSEAYATLTGDELLIRTTTNVEVQTDAACMGGAPFLAIMARDSSSAPTCAYECGTVSIAGPWTGQPAQTATGLRFRCMDTDGTTSANGYVVATDDNSFITTWDSTVDPFANFGIGAGYGGAEVDFDVSTDDFPNASDPNVRLLFVR